MVFLLIEAMPFSKVLDPQLPCCLVAKIMEASNAIKRIEEVGMLGKTPMLTWSADEKVDVIQGT